MASFGGACLSPTPSRQPLFETSETALQHRLFCSAEVFWTKSCAAASEKLHCNIEKAALQESGAFLPLSCGFQAPTFRHPRLGPAEHFPHSRVRTFRVFGLFRCYLCFSGLAACKCRCLLHDNKIRRGKVP